MTKEQLAEAVKTMMLALPEEVIETLEDVELLMCDTPEEAHEALKQELRDDYDFPAMPSDCKGVFIGEPIELETAEDGEEEIIEYPEGFIVLCAGNIASADETSVILLHEIGHALGMDEDEVKALGLGMSPGQAAPQEAAPPPESNTDETEHSNA